MVATNNQAVCAIIGTNGSLFVNNFDGASWSGFTDINLLVPTTPAPRFIFNPTCTDVLNGGGALCGAVTTAGQLMVYRFNGRNWGSPNVLNVGLLPPPNNIFITSDPSCSFVNTDGQLICGVRGQDNALYVSRFDGLGFLQFQNLGGILVSAPSCTSEKTNSSAPMAVCAVRGTDSALYVNQFNFNNVNNNNGGWSGFQRIEGTNIKGTPSCTALLPTPKTNFTTQVVCGVKSTDSKLWVTKGP
jgi:hypothetical protein